MANDVTLIQTKTMKALIIYKFLPQYRIDFFNRLKDELAANNIHLDVFYGKNKNSDSLKKDEVDIEWGKYIPNKIIKIGRLELIWQPCTKYLKDYDIVIVEQANKLLLNYYLIVARHFQNFKLALWGHGRNMQDDINSVRNHFKFLFIKKCDWWFAYTEKVKSNLIEMGYHKDRITTVQNAIDTSSLAEAYNKTDEQEVQKLRESLAIPGPNTGIYCGSMYPDKRIDLVIEACLLVKTSIPDFHFIFVGAGIDACKAKKAAEKYDWIHYVGPKFGKDRIKYFKLASIQLMPRLVGLAILDSFALRTPIVTTEHPFHGPEIEYLENNINGIITRDSIQEYAEAIINIFKTKHYTDLIDGCKNSAAKYSIEIMVENFKQGVVKCLKGKTQRSYSSNTDINRSFSRSLSRLFEIRKIV